MIEKQSDKDSKIDPITNDKDAPKKTETPIITLAVSSKSLSEMGAPASVLEDGNKELVYTFTRMGDTSDELSVNYTVGGTADSRDYTGIDPAAKTKMVTFAAGSATATVTVNPKPDKMVEPDETVELKLEEGTGYSIGTPDAAIGTITNDDVPSITLAVAPASVLEDGKEKLVYTFTRTDDTSDELTVNYTVGGTADSSDYTGIVPAGKTKTVTFAAGSATATVTVDPKPDKTSEADETVELTLASGIGYRIGTPGSVRGAITNDDVMKFSVDSNLSVLSDEGVPSVATDRPDYAPGETAKITASDFAVGSTIEFAIADDPNRPGDDGDADVYPPFSITDGGAGDLDGVANGEVITDWFVPTDDNGSGGGTPDALNATLNLTATGRDGQVAATTFTDAETPSIKLAVAPASVKENDQEKLVYTFTRSGDTSDQLTVYYTVGGTADQLGNDKDYTGLNKNSVTFKKGEDTATVTVNPQPDKTPELDETVEIALAPGKGYDIGTPGAATGTITNDDGSFTKPSIGLTVSASAPTAAGAPPGSVLEGSQEKLIYTFKRTGDTSDKLTVNFTVDGTAISNDKPAVNFKKDKNSKDKTGSYSVTFEKGEDTANFTVVPIDDDVDEPAKTVVLTLEKDQSYDIGTPDAVTGTIIDDDQKRPGVGESEVDYSLSGSSLKARKDKDKTKAKLPPTKNTDAQITSSPSTASALNLTAAAATADNPIVTENQKAGVSSAIWDAPISNQIEGFATDISVDNGSTVNFKINVSDAGAPYDIEIYRLGYYGGAGATLVTTIAGLTGTAQPNPIADARGVVDAGNWSVSASWATPADAVSGVYLAKLVRTDNGATNQIPFIVREDEARADGSKSDIVLQTSDTTWHAYNGWGGNNGQIAGNFYGDFSGTIDHPPVPDPGLGAQNRAYAVSYNRPFLTRDGGGAAAGAQDYLFGADYAALYWLEKNGYDVSYISGVDADRLDSALQGHKAYISVGHDEYWSGAQRDNVEAARDAGVSLLFWSGNEVYWKTRWENSISADGTPYRTLVSYKETWANGTIDAGPGDYANIDPSNEWTGTWRDLRFVGNPGATGQEPENSLTGQLFGPDGTGEFGGALDVPVPFAGLRIWRDTTVAPSGQLDIAEGILGYEWNTSPEDEYRPAGLIKLSDTTIPWSGILIDQGNRVAPGTATHNLSLYRDTESGALVFGAGTVFWSWGLSDQHDSSPYGANIENTELQQFTVNMFAEMGIQPGVADAFLASQGLVRADGTTDTVAATTTLPNIDPGGSVEALTNVLITGTAADANGTPATSDDGKVAVVEISLDGGTTWEVAQTSDNWATWSYNWLPPTPGTYTIQARAIDDSLNIANITPAEDTVTVTAPVDDGIYSLLDLNVPVTGTLFNDGTPVELGMTFSVSEAGRITELKYYRDAGDAGDTDQREGHLWSADGTLLETVTFNSAPGQDGWQVAALSTPLAVAPGQQYIVSYKTNNNYLSANGFFNPANEVAFDGLNNDAFSDPFDKIRAPQSDAVNLNGVYKYSTALAFPDETYQGSNYWVDVTLDTNDVGPNTPPEIASGDFTVPENQTAVGTVTATDAENNAIVYAIAGGDDAAQFNINATSGALSFIGAPDFEAPADTNTDNVYELTVSASDNIAPPVTKAIGVTVTDVEPEPPINTSLFNPSDPVTAGVFNDNSTVELGMKFRVDRDGDITGLKYYRDPTDAGDTDTREGRLWRVSDNALLGTVTFNSGSGQSGWQEATLSTPVAIDAATDYIVSYRTENNYVATSSFFAPANEVTFDGLDDNAFTDPSGAISAPESTVVSGGGVGGNGVYQYGTALVMPNQTYNANNYWVDVSFAG
jgi:hypothetical protein